MIMKRKLQFSVLFVFLITSGIFFTSSCTQDEDPCDETKWESTQNYSVQAKLVLTQAVMPDGYNIREAVDIEVWISMQKYHCGGNLSQIFGEVSNHDPRAIDDEHWYGGFYVGRVLGFDFNNDEDYLAYKFSLGVKFEDGNEFFTPDISGSVKPPFIPDWSKYFFYISVNDDVDWSDGIL